MIGHADRGLPPSAVMRVSLPSALAVVAATTAATDTRTVNGGIRLARRSPRGSRGLGVLGAPEVPSAPPAPEAAPTEDRAVRRRP